MGLALFWLLFAVVTGIAASARGRNGIGWFLLAVLLSPLIGLLLVLVLPSQRTAHLDPAAPTADTHTRCPDCRELVRLDARKCKHCGSALEPQALPPAVHPSASGGTGALATPQGGATAKVMIWAFVAAVVVAALLLSGCVGAFVPIQTVETTGLKVVEAAASIRVVAADEAKSMRELGEVTGYSCKNKLWDPDATIEAATFQVKVAAAQRGALAISGLTCSEGSVSLATNCWKSFTCKALALQ